jgi:DNA-binding NtrC family response regulator
MEKLLVVAAAQELQEQLRGALADQYTILEARDLTEAMDVFSSHLPKVVLLDLEQDEYGSVAAGFRCLEWLVRQSPGAKLVALTGELDREVGRRAVDCGAYDFYLKPVEPAELRIIVDRAFHLSQVEEQMTRLQEALDRSNAGIEGIAGQCAALKDAFEAIQRAKQMERPDATTAASEVPAPEGVEPGAFSLGLHASGAPESLQFPFMSVQAATFPQEGLTLREARDRVERRMIAAAVDNCGGNVAKASELLGISRPALYDLMKKHGIFKPSTRH